MKTLIALLIPLSVFGQNLPSGKFCSEGGYVQNCIDFVSRDSVVYSYRSCMLAFEKRGAFIFKGDSLVLIFVSDSQQVSVDTLEGDVKIVYNSICNQDSIDIKVIVNDYETKEALPFAIVYLSENKKPKPDKVVRTVSTDFDGIALFKMERSTVNLWLTTNYVSSEIKSLKVSADTCSTITVELAKRDPYDADFNRLSFKVNQHDLNQMKIVAEGEEYEMVLRKEN